MILQEDESRRLFQTGFAAIGEYDIKAISWSEFAAFYCQVPQVDGSGRKWTEVDTARREFVIRRVLLKM